jgi:uncharacterized protein
MFLKPQYDSIADSRPPFHLTLCTSVHTLERIKDGRCRVGCRQSRANVKKHGVDFADAATVVHDEQAITVKDESANEARFVTIGMDALARVLVVVYTWRDERSRLISARLATAHERKQYEGKP